MGKQLSTLTIEANTDAIEALIDSYIVEAIESAALSQGPLYRLVLGEDYHEFGNEATKEVLLHAKVLLAARKARAVELVKGDC